MNPLAPFNPEPRTPRKKLIMNNLKIAIYSLMICLGCFIPAASAMEELSNETLDKVCAGNIMYAVSISNSSLSYSAGMFSITDSDLVNTLEFENITLDNGSGLGFSYNTPENTAMELYFMADPEAPGFRYLVQESPDLSANENLPHLNVDNINFFNTSLGSLSVEDIALSGYRRRLDLRPRGSGLLHQDILIGLSIEQAAYRYNNTGGELSFNRINLSQTASGEPSDPSTWTFSGLFAIGDIESSTPLSIEAIYEDSVPYAQIDLPVKGTVRMESVSFGGNDFGPCAIDGIDMHSFYIRVPGR